MGLVQIGARLDVDVRSEVPEDLCHSGTSLIGMQMLNS